MVIGPRKINTKKLDISDNQIRKLNFALTAFLVLLIFLAFSEIPGASAAFFFLDRKIRMYPIGTRNVLDKKATRLASKNGWDIGRSQTGPS